MTDLTNVKELLSTGIGTEGQLLIPRKIHDMIIEEVDRNLIPRSEAALFFGPTAIPGSSIDVNLDVANTMDVRLIPEGANIPLDNEEYTSLNIKPLKYGVAIRITRELLEDSQFPLLEKNIKKAGKRLAENENSLVITQLDTAANTVSGGASVTIPNITRAMQYLEDSDFTATSFYIGAEVLYDLRNIDTFVEADKAGDTEMLRRGFRGVIYGMNVMHVSTNAGMTSTSSYVVDRTEAYALAVKRDVTVENFDLPSQDMSAAAVTQRIAAKALQTSAIAKITSS